MIKRIALSAALIMAATVSAFAQNEILDAAAAAAAAVNEAEKQVEETPKPNYWTNSIDLAMGFTNTMLNSWAAGGYNTVTLNSSFDGKANYKKELMSWDNRLQMEYGFLYSEDKEGLIQKNNDRIYLESTWGYQTGENSKWSYSASFNFRSQFADGYKYNTPSSGQSWKDAATIKSGLLAPAYTNIAFGMDWKPNNWFHMNFAPLTGGFTICRIEELRSTYGMKLKDDGVTYNSYLFQFGAQIKADFKLVFNEKFKYETQLVLFSDYLHEPQNLRVNWDNQISWQLAKHFAAGFKTWLIYDPNVWITNDDTGETKRLVQFKDFLSFNFTYTFDFKKK